MDIQQTINYCLSLDYNSLEQFASKNYQKLYDYLKTKLQTEKVNAVLDGSIFTFASADGKLTDEEVKFINKFVGIYSSQSLIKVTIENSKVDAQETATRLCNFLNVEMKEAFINLCIADFAVDKNVDLCEDFLLCLINQ